MGITETTRRELSAINSVAQQNSLTGLRSSKEFANKTIIALERRLSELRSAEILFLQRIRRDLELSEIFDENLHKADYFKTIDPIQAYANFDTGFPDPDERVTYARNKIERLSVGVQELNKEHDRISAQILDVDDRLTCMKAKLEAINVKLAAKGAASEEDLERDRISKRMTAELFMLWQIHSEYRKASQTVDGKKGYTEMTKVIDQLQRLKQAFVAFAERNPWVLSGKLILDFTNPGSDLNKTSIEGLLGSVRGTTKNEKIENDVKKYVEEMTKNINDPYVSRRLTSRQVQTGAPEEDNSFLGQTSTFAKALAFTDKASQWWSTLGSPNFIAAATNKFNSVISALHGNRTFCDNRKGSEEDAARTEAMTQKTQAANKAQEDLQVQYENLKATDPFNTLNTALGELQYLYGTAEKMSSELLNAAVQLEFGKVQNQITINKTTIYSVDGYTNGVSVKMIELISICSYALDALLYNGLISESDYKAKQSKLVSDYQAWQTRHGYISIIS